MIMRPPVTVIIPIYNVSRYIEKCARSIFEQTLENLEIIFVNDCSPDDSVKIIKNILKDYPNRELQTRIINMSTNTGIAGSRRRGIIEATGDFVIHCDGDDWLDKDLYKRMYDQAIEYRLDIVVCDIVYEYQNYSKNNRISLSCNQGKCLVKNWYKDTLHMSGANKLVRRTLYTKYNILPWPGLNMWDDNGLLTRLLYYANSIGKVEGSVYHYNRCNESSITSEYGITQVNQMIKVADNLSEFFMSKPDGKDFEKTVNAFKYLAKLNLITDSFANYRRFKKLFPESNSIVLELDRDAFSSRGRLRFKMVRYGLSSLFILAFKLKKLIKI